MSGLRTEETAGIEKLVNRYLMQSDKIVWERFAHFQAIDQQPWSGPALTRAELVAVKTAFLVEDHIPGYSTEYLRIFPVNTTVSPAEIIRNRTLIHFILRWCAEEDRHAHVLELYLRKTKQADEEDLAKDMAEEGAKPYRAPHEDKFQLFTYTVLQEKATQLFYQALRLSVQDPLLKEILNRLTQDEARHCHFFSEMILYQIQRRGAETIPLLQETLERFTMPLSNMIENYKRKSIYMARAAKGYHHQQSFDHFTRLLNKFLAMPSAKRDSRWEDFLKAIPAAQ